MTREEMEEIILGKHSTLPNGAEARFAAIVARDIQLLVVNKIHDATEQGLTPTVSYKIISDALIRSMGALVGPLLLGGSLAIDEHVDKCVDAVKSSIDVGIRVMMKENAR